MRVMSIRPISLRGVFTSACASLLLASTAAGQTREDIDTGNSDLTIISMSQVQGRKLAAQAREQLPGNLQRKYNTTAYNKALERRFTKLLTGKLRAKHGFSGYQSKSIAKIFKDSYLHDWHYQSTPVDGVHTILPEYFRDYGVVDPQMKRFCIIGTADSGFPAQMWMSTFTHPSYLMAITPEQQTYTKRFESFANHHERAHCFVKDSESKADYWAAAKMLNESEDPQTLKSTVRFLKFFAALRYYNSHYNKWSDQHRTTEQAIYSAIADYETGLRLDSDADLKSHVLSKRFQFYALDPQQKIEMDGILRALLPSQAFDSDHIGKLRAQSLTWMQNM